MGRSVRERRFNRLSGQNVKALLGEVDVEAECLREIQQRHSLMERFPEIAVVPAGDVMAQGLESPRGVHDAGDKLIP
jgi:hypothetical protein